MVCVWVQRHDLWLGNCPRHGYVRTHTDQVFDPERNRRGKDISPVRTKCAEPAKDRMARAVDRSQGVYRPTVAFTGFARGPNYRSAESDPKRREFSYEQRQDGEVAGHGADPGKGCRRGKDPGGLGAIARSG